MAKKTVLIADDDPEMLRALTLRIRELGVRVQTVSNGLDVLQLSLTQPPHLLVLDVNMPAADGLTVCEKLAEDHKIPPFPVIILTGRSDHETIRRCTSSGAHYFHKGLDVWDKMKPVMCGLLEIESKTADAPDTSTSDSAITAQDQEPKASLPPKVLVIDDDPYLSKAVEIRLKLYGVDVVRAKNGKQGYWMALKEKPDVILTDLTMPELSGEALIRKLIYTAETRKIPIFVLTGQTINGKKDFAMERQLLSQQNAVAYFTKPVDFDHLLDELGRHINISYKAGSVRRVNHLEEHS